jgi:hypothetical protein
VGRRPEERACLLTPRLPGRAAALALVEQVARELADRRMRIGAYGGPERRVDRYRTDRVPSAA